MGAEETPPPVVAGSAAGNDGENNISDATAAIAAQSSEEAPPGASMPRLPCLRVHPEESVAYITVSDPVQHTDGIKGKFTMYRIAYDPPPPTVDADVANAGSTATGTNKALFPYATSVNRRYSDFSWLFDHLHKERPGAIVPPLPEKQQVSRFTESFIEERRFHLEVLLRRVVRNPELIDTECLLVFLGGGDAEFKKAKKDSSFGSGVSPKLAVDAATTQARDDDVDYGIENPNVASDQENTLMQQGRERLIHKKKGIKKWIKERKTNMQGTLVRSPDDVVFEEVSHFISALEAGLKRIEVQASAMVKRDKDASSCLLEFGLGCDALAHVDDEINSTTSSGKDDVDAETTPGSGISQTFRHVGKTADALSVLSADHYERELRCFAEPLKDHLKMIHAAKVALVKRHNRRITYSTCLNAVDSKKASLHRYRITPGQEGKAYGVESSLSRAEQSVIEARANYEEVSARVLREVDRFRRENAAAIYATMAEFARVQREHAERVCEAWKALVPQVEGIDAAEGHGGSFVRAAEKLRESGGNRPGLVASGEGGAEATAESAATQAETMPMPSYPPPPEPVANGVKNASNTMESSMLNGAVRYRDTLPEE